MLTSICRNERKAYADIALKSDSPFKCPMCGNETILRKGKVKVHHFAHKPPVSCEYGKGESEAHRRCKQSIYNSLKQDPNIIECELEKNFGRVVSDVFFIHNGVKIAIEVQNRESWKGGSIDVPRCKIMLDNKKSWRKK